MHKIIEQTIIFIVDCYILKCFEILHKRFSLRIYDVNDMESTIHISTDLNGLLWNCSHTGAAIHKDCIIVSS